MDISRHPVWSELAERVRPMPELRFCPIPPESFSEPEPAEIIAALSDLRDGRIDLQGFIYRMALLECEGQ